MFSQDLIQKIKLPFRKDKELYSALYHILGFYPKDISLYKLALQHKSLSQHSKGKGGASNNERLEFLGDAILGAVVGDIVYNHFPGKREGFLTNTRSKIVQRETLNKLASEIGLTRLIRFSNHNQSHNSNMGGNAFEAFVGAIYLDYGYDRAMRFIERQILKRLVNIDKVAYKEVNFKSKLIEWSQKNRIRLQFELVEESVEAQNGSPVFTTQVVIEEICCGTGKGYSKKESQQNAAHQALTELHKKDVEAAIFEAKGKRTAMEEQPQTLLPSIDEEKEPVITEEQTSDAEEAVDNEMDQIISSTAASAAPRRKARNHTNRRTDEQQMSRDDMEEIIAKAEEEAFNLKEE